MPVASLIPSKEAVLARLQAAQADNLELDVKQKQSDLAANTEAYLASHGLKPNAVISGSDPGSMHSQASGTLTTLAQQNGGTVPRVATINDPIGAGQDPTSHSIKVFAPNNPDIVASDSSMPRKLIDTYLNITRGYPTTDSEWGSGFNKVTNDVPSQGVSNDALRTQGRLNQLTTAMQFLQPPLIPKGESGKVDNGTAASMVANMEQQRDTYAKNPNADPKMLAILQQKIDVFNGAVNSAVKREGELDSQRIAGTSSAQASAAAATEVAKKQTSQKPSPTLPFPYSDP